MNYRMICRVLGDVLGIEAALMLLPLGVTLYDHENPFAFLIAIAATLLFAGLLLLFRPRSRALYAREGFVSVALSWVLMSLFGALPFRISGWIPSYVDAVFETVSGFTTTGSSILTRVEALPRGLLFWRSFTHWIGGMGVLVFILAVMPLTGDNAMHIMRAEVPGPTVGKLVPRARQTARILYLIYMVMTVLETVLLLLGDMPLFDALIHAFGTAGTGGFSSRALSVGAYQSAYIDWVIGIFMALFSVNFNLYFLILSGGLLDALRDDELRLFVGIVAFATVTIALNIRTAYGGLGQAMRYSFFQVSSIISTTGYCTTDFNLWPEYSRWMLVLLMFVGACGGSTGGGVKVGRYLILLKSARCEFRRMLRPRSVNRVMSNGHVVEEETIRGAQIFFFLYIMALLGGTLVVSFDGFDLQTNFTATLSCLSNIGPGLSLVGPMGSFAMFSDLSKIVLSFAMLVGRLEVFPILMLFSRSLWK